MLKLTRNLGSSWVHRVADVLIFVSAAIILSYILFSTPLASGVSEDLGLNVSLWSAILALLGFFFGLLGVRLLKTRAPNLVTYATVGLLAAEIGSLVATSGGYESPFLALWIMLSLLIGVFGPLPLALLWLTGAAYFILNQLGVGEVADPSQWLVNFLLAQIPFIAGGLFWHNVDTKPQKGTIDILSNSLEGEKRKADIVINAIADGVVVISQSATNAGQITLFNPAAQDILGWTWEEALNLDYRSVIKLVNEADKPIPDNQDPFSAVVKSREAAVHNDLSVQTKAGKRIDVSLVVSPIRSPDGQVTATIGVFRDVSAERKEQKQRADFISTASHEMRTPVAAIEGYLALAMNEKVAKIDSKARDYLGKAIESTRHLGKLFQDLLTSAKAEDGRLTSHPKITNIGEMVEQLTEDLRFTAEKKGLQVRLDNGSGGKEVVAPIFYSSVDPERMREVITNLFDNAVKYSDEGYITLSYTGTVDRVTITVADTGSGIPQEDIPHLFQKFYRVDTSATQKVGGTGLGLFITKKIVELYGGRIWVESTFGQGSNFYISLPRVDNERAQEMMRAEAATATPLSDVANNQSLTQ